MHPAHLANATPALDLCVIGAVCVACLVATAAIHHEAIGGLGRVRNRWAPQGRILSVVVMLWLFLAHTLEIILYAVVFDQLARLTAFGTLGAPGTLSFATSLYFSFETYSSLGYGDVVPTGALRMLAGAEALNGLVLIGWSACYGYSEARP